MIDLNANGKAPAPPYVAIDIISPKLPQSFLEEDGVFEAILSFTVYDKSKLDCLIKANELREKFGDQLTEDELAKQNIVLVERMEMQLRSVAETNAYAYMAGFDCRLRLQESYANEGAGEILDIKLDKGEIKDE